MEENSLRLVLLIMGVVILIGIYLYDVFKKKRNKKTDSVEMRSGHSERVEPVFLTEPSLVEDGVLPSISSPKLEPRMESEETLETMAQSQEDVPVASESPVIQLMVLPKAGGVLSGTGLLNAFTQLNLEFGDMGIFHCYERQSGVEVQLFHVANILEPGTFPVGSMTDFESTGVVLFFQVTDSIDSEETFERMLNVAQQLSQVLDAVLTDSARNELTIDKISDIQKTLSGLSNL